jgi:hypothetical protein
MTAGNAPPVGTHERTTRTHDLPGYDRLPRRVPPLLGVPRLRRPDLGRDFLSLITVQSRDAYEALHRDGVLHGDPRLGEPDYAEAYAWMSDQMGRRVPENGPGMLWLWARVRRSAVIDHARANPGSVLLSVRVARDRVLISDYLDWHQVLNRSLNVGILPHETDEEWSRRFDTEQAAWDERTRPFATTPIDAWPATLRDEIQQSWNTIFDLDAVPPHRPLQATIRCLRANDVTRAVRIVVPLRR